MSHCSKTVITGGGYSNAKTVYDYQIALSAYLKSDANEDKELSHLKIQVQFHVIMKML